MKKLTKVLCLLLTVVLLGSLSACETHEPAGEAKKSFTIGVCNYVDDASLNQIYENLSAELTALGEQNGVDFTILYENCNADAAVLSQIISEFQARNVDLMVGIATPVAMSMQGATEESQTPVIFAAVSDPVGSGLVASLDAPGGNLTGTSDYLNTAAVLELIFAANPETKTVGLLYDPGQDASTAPIAAAREVLASRGITVIERTGTTVDEVMLAAQALCADKVDAVFTPTDNTIMKAELSIYETFQQAGIPHYCGADSFALNGALVGYGVDYANLGRETGKMVYELLTTGADPASTPVKTFDNGTATVNTDTCAALGLDYDTLSAAFAPFCTKVQPITTAESFGD